MHRLQYPFFASVQLEGRTAGAGGRTRTSPIRRISRGRNFVRRGTMPKKPRGWLFRARSHENRELKKGLRPDTQRPYFRKGTVPDQSLCSCTAPTKDLAGQKFCQTRRKGGRALTAYSVYAEVHGRPTTKYDGIYAREIMRSRTRIAASAISFAHSAARSAVKRFG